MLRLNGGPAEGTYMCQRAPRWLRAVVDADGRCDVLDQLTDKPMSTERVHVYQRVGDAHTVHLSMADRRKSGFYAAAEYEYVPEVDGETVRDTDEWHAFCAIEGNTSRQIAGPESESEAAG